LNDHELTVLVDAAASGAIDAQAALHGSTPWADMDPMSKIAVKEAALPFIFHGTKALADLGYSKPRLVTTVDEMDALPVGSVVLDPLGLSLHRDIIGWNCSNGTRHVDREELERDAFPATVIHEPVDA
jgi:hypothetical protein